MKLLVSNRTNTLVPTNASLAGAAARRSPSGCSPGAMGFRVPSSRICMAGRFPSENVASFSLIPSSMMRKSAGFKPLTYFPLLSVTVKLSTTRSTRDLNTGVRAAVPVAASCAKSQIPPPATARTLKSKPKRAQFPNFRTLIDSIPRPFQTRCYLRLPPKFLSHRSYTLQQRGPILEVRCEDPFHHLLRPFRHQHVQLSRLDSHLVAQVGPIEQVRFPTLRHDPARVAHESRKSPQVQQLLT